VGVTDSLFTCDGCTESFLNMNIVEKKTIGLLIGNGKVVRRVWTSLNDKHTVVPVGLVPGSEAVLSQYTETFTIGQVAEICDYLKSNGVTEIAFAGDLGLVKNQDEGDLAKALIEISNVTDLTIQRLIRKKAPVEGIVNRIGQILNEAGIQLKHVNEIVSDFQIGEGWITKKQERENTSYSSHIEFVRNTLLEIRNARRHALERSAIVFDGDGMLRLPNQSTDDLLASIEHLKKPSGALRSFVKVSTAVGRTNLAAPVVGAGTMELCHRAGIDLVILDSRNGLIVDMEECIEFCDANGISVFGMSLQKD